MNPEADLLVRWGKLEERITAVLDGHQDLKTRVGALEKWRSWVNALGSVFAFFCTTVWSIGPK